AHAQDTPDCIVTKTNYLEPQDGGKKMANGVNRVIIIGNLGADPEVRYTQSGSAVTNLRLATSEQWKDRQTGEKQERTEWHQVAVVGGVAEVVGEYVAQGRQVYVEGSLRTNKWQDEGAGEDRYSTEIVARETQMLGGREAGGQSAPRGNSGGSRP